MALMAKKKRKVPKETDNIFLLKIVLYLIVGSLWLKVTSGEDLQIPIPIGFLLGLMFIKHEHFQVDRKIEYVVLLLAALLGFWLPFGIYITL